MAFSNIDPVTEKPFRSLAEILQEADQHYLDNPTHGIGCACLDELIREIRRNLAAVDLGSTESGNRKYKTGFDWFDNAAYMLSHTNVHRYDGPKDE